jgi:hydrogenase/urease accessory protein HupE
MRIEVARDHVTVQVSATWEEILVAATAAGRGTAPLDERVRRHGDYVLSRLTVEAGGQALSGTVIATPAPDAEPPFTYTFSYPSDPLSRPRERVRERADRASRDARGQADPLTLTLCPPVDRGAEGMGRSGDSLAHSLTLRNAVLRELGLALGGPWEVSYVVTVSDPSGHSAADPVPRLLTAATPLILDLDATLAPPATRARLAWAYLRQGILHILRGYDHLLFVAALVLAAVTLRDLIKVVVAFTLAHATTLTLCALGWISIREAIVEPLIAASIVVVALQNLLAPSSSRRAPRLAIAFGFGLLHGCGFASGALQAMRDLPAAGLGLAVGAFSLGVELGHQAIVIPTFMLLNRLRERTSATAMIAVRRAGSAAIAVAGGVCLWLALHR